MPVDYTQIRHVSKPAGAKPGMVVYVQYKTVFVTPESPPPQGNKPFLSPRRPPEEKPKGKEKSAW